MPLPEGISRTQLDKLGERLAAADVPADDDLDLLLDVLSAYQAALVEVQARLSRIGYHATTRTKTTGVLVDKLRRERSSLKSVQDIAGARIVSDCDRDEQDDIVSELVAQFHDEKRPPKIKDRRAEPSSGYRAVHVIVHVQDLPVEIQVRTQRQDTWAQIAERLGDRWGRGIRYGQDPPDADEPAHPGLKITRRRLWTVVSNLSQRIDDFEEAQRMVNAIYRNDDFRDPGVLTEQQELERGSFQQQVSDLKQRLDDAEKDLMGELSMIAALTEIME
ncbi:MAG: RelA/SpoT domain protein [Frankiales bacterium]|nr:RelA/SpoT domain protein [Frankiales bacterium]